MDELDAQLLKAGQIDAEVSENSPEAMAQAQQIEIAVSLADANGRMVAGALEMASPMIAPLYPRVAGVYTPEVCSKVGDALGPVLAKYNINLGEWGGRYAEEIKALFVCVPVALATFKALKEDAAERAREAPGAQTMSEAVEGPKPAPADTLKPGDFGYPG